MISLRKCLFNWFLLLPISFAFSNVTVTIGDADVSGYTSDIVVPVSIENPVNTVGGLQFDILSTPDLLLLSSVSAIDADNFSADYNVLDDGSARVVFYSNNGSGIAAGGNGTVINLHYNGSDILSAFFELEGYALTVSDEDGAIIGGQINSGSLTIGDVVTMSATSDTGDISEEVMIDIHLGNSGLVGGLQFDIADSPNYIDVIGLTTTERSTGFNIDFNELANGLTRVIMYNAENSNIEIGTGPIARLQMVIHENAYNSNVGINFENVTITDAIGGSYFIESIDSGTVTVSPGYIEEPHNLQAQDGMDAEVLLSWDAPYGPIPQEFEEDFEEGSVPEGWVATTNSAQGWFITQDGSSDFWSIPSHSWYMCSNDDMANDDGSADYLILPPLNVSGADNISLNFASYYDGSYSQTAHIAVSTDGTNFTEVSTLNAASEWVMESVDLSEYGGAANLYIAFHANDNGAWASGWAVDDVLVSFAVLNTQRALHYNLTELGQWAVSAPKED
ncbi:MAG: choice-of-anchor J domain-containing protein, partial [Fidelibacterota bacterium]